MEDKVYLSFKGVTTFTLEKAMETKIVKLSDSDEDMCNWAKPQLAGIAEYIDSAYSNLVNSTYIQGYSSIEECNDQGICCIWLEGQSISIEPARLMVKSIGRNIERYGWTVTTYHHCNNYPYAPDDCEDREFGQSFSTLGIASIAMDAVWVLLRDAWQISVQEQEYARSLEIENE